MLSSLQWSSIESQHKEARLMLFFKIIHRIANLQLLTYIQHLSRQSFEIYTASSQSRFLKIQLLPFSGSHTLLIVIIKNLIRDLIDFDFIVIYSII